mgnify:CR=1 FL=1
MKKRLKKHVDIIEHSLYYVWMEIFDTLRALVRKSNKTLRSIAREAEISPALLCRVCNGTRGVSLERAEKVFRVLGYRLTTEPIESEAR